MRNAALREQIKKKHGGRNEIAAKYHAKYPDSAEREYIRVSNAYMVLEKQVLMKYIPELKQILQDGSELRTDSASDNDAKRKKARILRLSGTANKIQEIFVKIKQELLFIAEVYHLPEKLERIADMGHKTAVKEWKKVIHKTLGIDILEDYYSSEQYQKILKEWIAENVSLIQTVPMDSLGKMQEIIFTSYIEGSTVTDIVRQMQKQYVMDKSHARMIARDQTARLNAAITQHQQTDAGIDRYKWSAAGDSRTRDCHAYLDGKIFSWDNPQEMWYMTKKGRVMTGRRCHPGEDYQCRCCALPVFDIDKLELPV